ncbi:retinol dehydrogenase 12-like protein [Dinothrombium tinctorium]|uniref:Retinol dehydrogenase 12-like protein n=1 Tax=Dinothrombium tinctorium TaxID=1965070 RepID=A0A3S3SDP8_9ACAR|nr:retinol dehydrogenase 12-like protein [Dinothrombium tinctorium]RWS12793.1 retinol dehydrogenase 12-like protein [Dinothrombium tinctorium]RWS16785.1 retinol dehydrogenase 12-like protein [Dinothrombium tinctorium]
MLVIAALTLCSVVILVIFAIRKYLKSRIGKYESDCDLKGKVVVITGANTGIGEAVAKDFAKREAKVIIACRSLERGKAAADKITEITGNKNVLAKECDLASLKSVRNFVDDFLNSEERLDILICNAGIGGVFGRNLTEDGIEIQFQTNHLGHFLMVNLLLDILKKSSPARIIITSSSANRFGKLDIGNIVRFDKYISHPFFAYCDTKLANLLFMKELAARLQGTGVVVNAMHPGAVNTNMIKHNAVWYFKLILKFLCFMQCRSIEDGAQTIVFLGASREAEHVSGKYFFDCKPCNYNPSADDSILAKKLWNVSEELCGLSQKDFKCSQKLT